MVKWGMLPAELIFFTANILALPPVARVHEAGLDLLRAAFTQADFQVGQDIPPEMKGLAFYFGGFEVFDPGTNGTLRVMSMLGHSTSKAPESGGLAYTWTVTQSLEHMRTLPADRRELMTRELRSHRLTPLELAVLDADGVLRRFEGVLAAPGFLATPGEAHNFVARLVDALAP